MKDAESVTFGGSAPGGTCAIDNGSAVPMLGVLDRDAARRSDTAGLSSALADPGARVLPMWRGKPLVVGHEAARLSWVAADCPVLDAADASPVYLGRVDGAPRFAADVSNWEPAGLDLSVLGGFSDDSLQHPPGVPDDHVYRELRAVMTRLSPVEAEMVATARALFNWHRSHGFCARCGQPTEQTNAGWQRRCPACGSSHFPRTDPVVIMLITRGDRVLLGRSPAFPPTMYSLLAGFIEPGETVEAAVRREVAEETGIAVGAVRYLASQPWPFPNSLMIGCAGEALTETITVDPEELEDARWATRQEVLASFAGEGGFMAARPGAIAHFLLRAWLSDRLD